MTVQDHPTFLAELQRRGYTREANRMRANIGHADDQWWKAFGRTHGHRHYTVVVRLYDHTRIEGYDVERFGRWGVSFRMHMNHQTPVLCEVFKLEMTVEGMDLDGWEQRCAELYEAMARLWPRQPAQPATTPSTPCYMCGAPSTRRMTPDPDIEGVALCVNTDCSNLLSWYLLQPDMDMNQGLMHSLERERKRRHKAMGNRYTK